MELLKNYLAVKETIPANVTLVAVSKFKPVETILALHEVTGHCIFGENRARELSEKHAQLSADISWHFIGHLQTNKIKLILPFVDLIQSVDSYKLLKEINKEANRLGKIINVLLQFHIATEETKFGLSPEEAFQMIEDNEFIDLQNINIRGVMGMASYTDEQSLLRKEFKTLRQLFERFKLGYFNSNSSFAEVSMGMSGDYLIAIEEGSSMVRIGSRIFGER